MPDYDAMSADYAADPPTAEEVISIDITDPAILKKGRPAKGEGRTGRTPVTSVRLDPRMRQRLRDRAAKEHVGESDVIRKALDVYLAGNPGDLEFH